VRPAVADFLPKAVRPWAQIVGLDTAADAPLRPGRTWASRQPATRGGQPLPGGFATTARQCWLRWGGEAPDISPPASL